MSVVVSGSCSKFQDNNNDRPIIIVSDAPVLISNIGPRLRYITHSSNSFTMPKKQTLPLILTLPKPGESMKRSEDGSDIIETFEFNMCVYPYNVSDNTPNVKVETVLTAR